MPSGKRLKVKTNTIQAPAPLFDHGNSLFHQAFGEDWESSEALALYAQSLQPRVYDDFIGTAKQFMTSERRRQLRRLLDFQFEQGGRYQLPKARRRAIEQQIRDRAKLLLS